jgi:hypothetical protein
MARNPGAAANYEVADLFRQQCLVAQGSLLWPGTSAWTPANLDALWTAFVEQPDEGKRSFMEKWRDQLAAVPHDWRLDDALGLTGLVWLRNDHRDLQIGPANRRSGP